MHPPLIVEMLYGASIVLDLLLLCVVVGTGNARGLAPAVAWVSIDLTVTAISIVLSWLPVYAHQCFPLLLRFHTCAFAVGLVWMGRHAWLRVHPLSRAFFAGFALYAVCRFGMYVLFRMNGNHARGTSIWWLDSVVYLVIAGALALSFFLPVPPHEPEHDDAPSWSTWSGLPAPAASAVALRGAER